jgi:hypothetical protein
MLDRAEFRRTLIKPYFIFIALVSLLAAFSIGVVHRRGMQGRPHWAENIGNWNLCADGALLVAWIAYTHVLRVKATKTQ